MLVLDVDDQTALQRAFATRAGIDADLLNRRLGSWHEQQQVLQEWYAQRFDNVKVSKFASAINHMYRHIRTNKCMRTDTGKHRCTQAHTGTHKHTQAHTHFT